MYIVCIGQVCALYKLRANNTLSVWYTYFGAFIQSSYYILIAELIGMYVKELKNQFLFTFCISSDVYDLIKMQAAWYFRLLSLLLMHMFKLQDVRICQI